MYSIVIPTYGIKGVAMVYDLLDSISKFANPSLDEIIISDDGSNVDTIPALITLRDKYENIFKIIPLFNPYYHSFAKTVNVGMKISNPNNDVLLLNNDMLTLTNFEPFINFIKEKEYNNIIDNITNTTTNHKIGIIGAKLLYPNMTIQHAGMARLRLLKRFRHIYKYRNYNHSPTNVSKRYIAVTGACQYIKRELINKIGFLDERYILSYEDVDYCIKAQSNGYDVWYIPDVIMIHYESITRTDPYSEQNRALLWRKWNSIYEQIRSSRDIQDDDLDIKIAGASGATALLYIVTRTPQII